MSSELSFRWVVLATAGLRALVAACVPLSGDEAYYWDCSRHPDWSYFDQPALVIWSMVPCRALLGETTLAVRLPAVLAGVLASYFLARLIEELGGTRRQAARLWLLLHATPLVFIGFTYASTDAVMTTAYLGATWALVAIAKGRRAGWWGFGVALGLGFLGKYPVVLALVGLAGALVSSPAARSHLRGWTPYAAALLSCALTAPVWIWGARHGWDNITFQLERIPVGFRPANLLAFTLATLGLAGVFLGLAAARAWWQSLARRDPAWRTFQAASLAPFGVFGLLSLQGHVGLHWGGPSMLLACVPLALRPEAFPRLTRAGVVTGLALLGLLASVVVAPRGWLSIERWIRDREGRLEKLEARALFGQDAIAREIRDRLREGEFPATDSYSRAHTISFELPEAVPTRLAYCAGYHGLASLYWYAPAELQGRDVLFWTEKPERAEVLADAFASVSELPEFHVEVDGAIVRRLHFFRCRDLREPAPIFTRRPADVP